MLCLRNANELELELDVDVGIELFIHSIYLSTYIQLGIANSMQLCVNATYT